MNKKNNNYILVVSRGCPSETYPMLGVFEFDQAKALVDSGVKVVFASIDLRSIRRWRKFGIFKFQKKGVCVYEVSLPIGAIPKKMLLTIGFWSFSVLYKQIIKRFGIPSILHAHFADNIGYIVAKFKDKLGVPMVITEHSGELSREKISQNLMRIHNYAYSRADVILAVSTFLSHRLKKHFNLDVIVVPNIVDVDVFKYKDKKRTRKFTFVSVGCVSYGKGFDLLLPAFKRAFSDRDDVQLTIYGDIDEKSKLEKLITFLNLKSQVFLKGLSHREQIVEGLHNASCFVLPSRNETFGVAYIEALATGTPVIATRCGGPEDFVNASNGFLIPVGDIASLAEAMKKVTLDIKIFNGETISKDTTNSFSPGAVASSLIKIYKGLGYGA